MPKFSGSSILKGVLVFFLLLFFVQLGKTVLTRLKAQHQSVRITSIAQPDGSINASRSEAVVKDTNTMLQGERKMSLDSEGSSAPVAEQISSITSDVNAQSDSFRKIIRSAQLSLQVNDIQKAYDEISSALDSSGGYVLNSTFSESGSKQANLVLEVPSQQFDPLITRLERIGKTVSRSVSGQDVTEEYVDLESRIRHLSRVEAQFVELLTKAKSIPDILTVQRELDQVQSQIEQAKGRLQFLSHKSSMAQIAVDLAQVGAPVASPGFLVKFVTGFKMQIESAMMDVAQAFVGTISVLAILAIWGIGYLLPILLAAAALWKLAVKYKSHFSMTGGVS